MLDIKELKKECDKIITNLHGRYNGHSQNYKSMPREIGYDYIQVAKELIEIFEIQLYECVTSDLLLDNYYMRSIITLEKILVEV